ncbi:MAG: shikimate kinase [Desulfobacterales bacterium]|jgi:shikimate kinase|nr:shikimate kinase [Desulfobacterales bacterium]MDP6684071.1 shikimate kinase [Desulfobacterales bacterium]MDP6806280.1 shikimate kinase [Desulfobacterales bacterium]|tara:strand:+ start:87050 stop:87586 length:537 start_codon:yes stop_codon:yes gene_type:complete
MNIFLIGYRCVGKTTVGKSIARMMGRSFVDSDMLIVQESGQSIQKIVDTEGWNVFRSMERSMLKKICKKDHQVVATGGGMVLNTDNVDEMKKSGTIVWLRATTLTILERILQDENTGNLRPALTDKGLKEEIEETLLERNSYYENASDFFMNTNGIGVAEISKILIHKIKDIGMKNVF